MSTSRNRPVEKVTFDSVFDGARPVTTSTRICLDGQILAEIDEANRDLVQARLDDEALNRLPVAPEVARRVVELTKLAHESEIEFVFTSIGSKAWRDLVAKHPPTDVMRRQGADFNTETFPIAAMAAACVEPAGATVEKFTRLAETISQGQWNQLWAACHAANAGPADVPLSAAAYAIARRTETSSGQPEPTDSLAASS